MDRKKNFFDLCVCVRFLLSTPLKQNEEKNDE